MNQILINAWLLIGGFVTGLVSATIKEAQSDLFFYLFVGFISAACIHYGYLVITYKEQEAEINN